MPDAASNPRLVNVAAAAHDVGVGAVHDEPPEQVELEHGGSESDASQDDAETMCVEKNVQADPWSMAIIFARVCEQV